MADLNQKIMQPIRSVIYFTCRETSFLLLAEQNYNVIRKPSIR